METPIQPIIEVKNVERYFGSGDRRVSILRGLDLDVNPGELVALYGPSGSGKTTLLNLIGGLDMPNAGDLFIQGNNLVQMRPGRRARLRRRLFGFIFQNYTLLPNYTALENIDLVLRLPKMRYGERRRRSRDALKSVGLSAWATHTPSQLSGGQRQRIAIARALALQPSIVLADEPTSGLDTRTARQILTLFQRVAETQGTAFIIVSHDPAVVNYVDQAYDLHEGVLVARNNINEEEE